MIDTLTSLINSMVGLAAGRPVRRARFAAWLARASAAIFTGLALRLALVQRG